MIAPNAGSAQIVDGNQTFAMVQSGVLKALISAFLGARRAGRDVWRCLSEYT